MIVTETEQELLLFTQGDHAALAAKILTLWRRDGVPDHTDREDLLLATREHDNGWREADAAPRVDAGSGRPLAFNEIATEDRFEIWRRGVRRFGAARPATALLILRHAREVHRDYRARTDWRAFDEELRQIEDELVEESGVAASAVDDSYRFLELSDTLSLGACGALGTKIHREKLHGYSLALELGRVRLVPFPLAGSTTVKVAYRSLPKRPYQSALELSAELAEATWQNLPVRLEPLQSGR